MKKEHNATFEIRDNGDMSQVTGNGNREMNGKNGRRWKEESLGTLV